MAKRNTLWLPFTIGSNTSVANTQAAVAIDGRYLAEAAAEFKGTILAVRGGLAFNQLNPTNAYARYAFGIRVRKKASATAAPDLFDAISKEWLWRLDGMIPGPAGDSTALANIMVPFQVELLGNSKRVVGFSDEIVFQFKTDVAFKLGCSGRLLLLEA